MSDPRTPLAASRRELPAEEMQREERHQLLATLLAAFADGELPAETASQIDAHLLGCARCRRELVVHRTLRLRLEQEPLATVPASLRDRIVAAVAATPAPQWQSVAEQVLEVPPAAIEPARRTRLRVVVGTLAGLVIVSLAALGARWFAERNATPPASVVSASSVPLISAALADYRRVTQGDLPGRSRDLVAVREAMPFPVQPMQASSLRLLAAWTTSLYDEPAAVLAYRWNDRVVLQFLVSDLALYRSVEARNVLAGGRLLAARDGEQSIVAWPETTGGSIVIGDIPLQQLEQLRKTAAAR